MMSKTITIIVTIIICSYGTTLKASQILKGIKAKQLISNTAEIHINETATLPAFIKFDNKTKPKIINLEEQLMQWYQLKLPYGFDLIKITEDKLGFKHYRYKQTYEGYSIKNMVVYVHTKNGEVISVNGELSNKIKDKYSYQLNVLNALQVAKSHIKAKSYKWEIPQEEFHLSNKSRKKSSTYFPDNKLILIEDKFGTYRLCYEIDVFAHEPESRNLVYVNANTGQIEHTQNLICSNNSINTTVETKTSGNRNIIVNDTIVANKFALVDFTRGDGIGVIDSRDLSFVADDDNSWTLTEYNNTSRDYAAIDCHWGAAATYDYFLNVHNRNSYDNAGARIECRVHQTYSNGNTNNATWNGSYLSFGDGLSYNNAFTALDIIAHEFTHAVTGESANLLYAGESGALNESFSDIFGTAVEFYAKPPYENGDWILGDDVGLSLRNLSNPNSRRHPDTYGNNDPNWVEIDGCWPSDDNDLCGVHINSSVQNYWFYLLANGGVGTNHNGDFYNITGIGIEKATEIAYRNLTVYLTSRSRYADAKRYAIQSAQDLFGDCPAPQEVISTINAWYAVGLGEEYSAENILQPEIVMLSPTDYCSAPQTVSFGASSNFANTNYTWSFGGGVTAVGDTVSHTFTEAGEYNVALIATGCNAANIKTETNLITIDTLNPCVLTMPFNSKSIETVCNGTLYDVNGPGKPYSDLSEGIITIVSPLNEPINLLFTELGYEVDYDFLYIYDGPNTDANQLARLNGYDLPDTISSTSNSITIKHSSDLYVTDDGFTLNWWSDSCDPNAIDICPDEQVLTDNSIADSGSIKARRSIKSNQVIANNNALIYAAGDSINLINDFEVKKDGEFLAEIENCEP